MIIIQRRNRLDFIKFRISMHFFISIDVDIVFQFMYNIQKFSVLGKFQMPRRGFLFASYHIDMTQSSVHMVQPVNIDMVHPQVGGTQIFIVSRHLNAIDVRPEIALRNAAKSLVVNFLCNFTDAAVFPQAKHRNFSVMITAYE